MDEQFEHFCSDPYVVDIIHFPGVPLFLNEDLLRTKFSNLGQSLDTIAKDFSCSVETVRKYLRQMGLYAPKREKYKPCPPKTPKYGEKYVKGCLVPNLQEVKVIKLIKERHSKGYTLRQIARFLEGLGIQTKKGSKKWGAETIRRILKV